MLTRKLTRRITQALTRKATEPGGGGAASFDPASQFGSGEAGVLFYIPDDLSGLYQDAGTTPCTAAGQTVARWSDFSGHGKHLTLSGAVLRQHANGKWYIEANGLSTEGVTATVDFSGTDKITIQVAAFNAGGTGGMTIVRLGNGFSEAGTFDFGMLSGGFLCYRYASSAVGARGTPTIGSGITVGTCILDFAGTSQATENPTFRVNGAAASLTDYGTGDTGSGNFSSTNAITVATGQARFDGGIFAIVVRGVASSSADYQEMEKFLAGRSGASLPFDLSPEFVNTATPVARSGYVETSNFSRSVFTTEATTVTFDVWCSTYNDYPDFASLGIVVNGVFYQEVPITAQGANSKTVTLPEGSKSVEFVTGPQSRPNNGFPPVGTWLVGITASDAPLAQANPSLSNTLLIYGDSITAGGNATVLTEEAFPVLLRGSRSVSVEAYGWRALKLDAVDSAARAAFVTILASHNPSTIWLAIGTNDFGLNYWSASDFGTAYGETLDAIHAAMPSVAIYAQTPFTRDSGSANIFGDTLADYRSSIVTACSTRPWATLVDGTTLVTLGQLDDGVHPTTAGHAAIAANIAAILDA